PVPGDSGYQRFTVEDDGDSVAFDFDEVSGVWRLRALRNSTVSSVGGPYGSSYPGAHLHVAPPALPALDPGLPLDTPAYVVLKEHPGEGYRIAPDLDAAQMEVSLPETAPVVWTCVIENNGEPGMCPTSCEETGVGVLERFAATSRTTDGRIWVAYMVSKYDQTREYTETCDEEVGCYCNHDVTREDSEGELVLAQVDLVLGELHEVFRVRDTNPDPFGLFGEYRDSPRPLDMRAHGSVLTVAVRVRGDDYR